VVGEVGSGKTMLCRMLETRLPPRVELVYLANPSLPPEQVLHAIAFEMKLAVAAGTPRVEVLQKIYEALLEKHAAGRQVVVFVEEAQAMPLATLEEIRLLSNLETSRHKLLQMVLFGQPELDANLSAPGIRQLKERITQHFHLSPFKPGDIRAYLMHRLRTAGYKGPDVFGHGALRLLAGASKGLVRRINILADKALLAAYAENTHLVRPRHMLAAIQDSTFNEGRPLRIWGAHPALWAAAGTLSLALAGLFAVDLWRHPAPPAAGSGAVQQTAGLPAPQPETAGLEPGAAVLTIRNPSLSYTPRGLP
jgi:type II secretory pathway predicted ATPase ExeA